MWLEVLYWIDHVWSSIIIIIIIFGPISKRVQWTVHLGSSHMHVDIPSSINKQHRTSNGQGT